MTESYFLKRLFSLFKYHTTSKLFRNGTRIKLNLFADYIEYELLSLLITKKAFSIALPLVSVSVYYNLVAASKCLTGQGILRRITLFNAVYPVCRLPLKICTAQF